ncbi:MAG: hypothetical protein ACXVAW_19390 [Vulcanimicrobiaceae bacterium]
MALALIGLSACATSGALKQEPLDRGVSRTFTGNYDTILKAARDATVAAGLHLESVDKVDDHTWSLLGKKDASAWSAGELVRVVIQQTGPDLTAVRIISKKRIATNVAARGDYSQAIFNDIELKLK